MRAAYFICVGLAALGLVYAPGLNAAVALLFIAGSALPLLIASAYEPEDDSDEVLPPGPAVFWSILALGLVNVGLIARSVGRSGWDLLTLDGLLAVSAASTTARYEELASSSGNPFLLSASLLLVFWLGASTTTSPAWRKIVGAVPLMLYAMASTEKWPLFLAGAFYLSGILATHSSRVGRTLALKAMLPLASFGLAIFVIAMILRGHEADTTIIGGGLLHYVLGPFPALGWWLRRGAYEQCCGWGAMSFIGPMSALGLVPRNPGVHSEQFVIYGLETNIFTAWRYLAQDFTMVGPVAVTGAAAAAYVSTRLREMHRAALAVRCFVIICATISLNVTPFVHNSVGLTAILSALLCGFGARSAGAPDTPAPESR
jgi:hypothetical protein